jgi:phosphate transport system permease protein
MNLFQKSAYYLANLWEFLTDDPRESNTEGGIFPAIFGTVMMVLIMSVLVTPLGVLAAFYLREYAKQGPFVSAVRIAVNNLAGVPSIVFGVFGVPDPGAAHRTGCHRRHRGRLGSRSAHHP